MPSSSQILDRYFLEMRWRCLSLAADLDRVQRGGDSERVATDPRLAKLRDAFKVLLSEAPNRAEQVQLIFSDKSPPPPRS